MKVFKNLELELFNKNQYIEIFGRKNINIIFVLQALNIDKKFKDYIKIQITYPIELFPDNINSLFKMFPDFYVILSHYPPNTELFFSFKFANEFIDKSFDFVLYKEDLL